MYSCLAMGKGWPFFSSSLPPPRPFPLPLPLPPSQSSPPPPSLPPSLPPSPPLSLILKKQALFKLENAKEVILNVTKELRVDFQPTLPSHNGSRRRKAAVQPFREKHLLGGYSSTKFSINRGQHGENPAGETPASESPAGETPAGDKPHRGLLETRLQFQSTFLLGTLSTILGYYLVNTYYTNILLDRTNTYRYLETLTNIYLEHYKYILGWANPRKATPQPFCMVGIQSTNASFSREASRKEGRKQEGTLCRHSKRWVSFPPFGYCQREPAGREPHRGLLERWVHH
jgi:hypothetical protein